MNIPSIRYFTLTAKHIMVTVLLLSATSLYAQDISSPPDLGQETKGTPAVAETTNTTTADEVTDGESENTDLNQTEVVELRRDSGQIYQIELNHASGSKQYITETDSDGNIESTDNDIEETPNLPKWKIGSW